MIEISVIILTKNAGNTFQHVLESIRSQELEEKIELIIIDSGSIDATLQIAKNYSDTLHSIKPEDFHHSRTRNIGAMLAQGKYLIYLSQDALPCNTKWMKKLITPLICKESDAVYGRQIAYTSAKPMDKYFYSYFYPDTRLTITKKHTKNTGAFYINNVFISDVNVALTKDMWENIKFKEDIYFAEDKDFALRGLQQGYKAIYEPEAAVYHSHNYSLSALFRRRFNDGFMFSRSKALNNGPSDNGFNFIRKGFDYWLGEQKFMINDGCIKTIPYALIYDFVFFASFRIGGLSSRIKRY